MPESLRKFFRTGYWSGTPNPPSENPPAPVIARQDWLKDEPWHEAPVAMALVSDEGEVAWNPACRALLRSVVGGTPGSWRRWLSTSVRRMVTEGRNQETVSTGSDRSLDLEIRVGPNPRRERPRVVVLREVAGAGIPDPDLVERIGTLTHELRTPLTSMKSSLNLVMSGETGPVQEDQAHFLGMTMRNIDRLDRMVGDLLDVARNQAGRLVLRPRDVDLGPIWTDAARMQAEAAKTAGLRFDYEGLPAHYSAHIDPDKVVQVLDNVLSNAIKYTAAPGNVRVWLEARPRVDQGLAWWFAEKYFLPLNLFTLVVEDNGQGMTAEARQSAFKPFVRTHDESALQVPGAGLGLHITRGLVQALGGQIRLESRPGQGTTIWVRLPRDQETARLQRAALRLEEELGLRESAAEELGLAALDLRNSNPGAKEIGSRIQHLTNVAAESEIGVVRPLAEGLWGAVVTGGFSRWSEFWESRAQIATGARDVSGWRLTPLGKMRRDLAVAGQVGN